MGLEKPHFMLYPLLMGYEAHIMGIVADSHGDNRLLAAALETLKGLGARTLVHLGDMCDTLSPHLVAETLRLLKSHGVRGVRGNNECQMIHDLKSSRGPHIPGGGVPREGAALEELPYVMSIGPFWFSHSVPYPFPAATRRPVSEFLPALLEDPAIPFSILFRGHSHRPSILEIRGRSWEKIPAEADKDIPLDGDQRYVITVGAVEKASCVLFLPGDRLVRFVTVPGT
jgi:predicted phosphodiesterase